jgi:hypothetical protein
MVYLHIPTFVEELFLSVLNVYRVSEIRQMEIQTTEAVVPEPFETEIARAS